MRTARLVLIVALLATGCGAPSRTMPNGSPVTVLDQACADRIQPLYNAERDLDSRLNVGLVETDYSTRVGDVRVAYDAAGRAGPFEAGACFEAAEKLQSVLNEYTAALSIWTACIGNVGCTLDSIKAQLQTHWAQASSLLDDVQYALP